MAGTGRPADHEQNRQLQERFLAAYSEKGVVSAAAEAAGIYPVRHYQWLKQYPDYAEQFAAAKASAPDGVTKARRKPRKRGYKVGGQRGAERDARQAAFLAAFGKSGIIADAARDAGVSLTAHHQWMRSDPAYAEHFRKLQDTTADTAAEALADRRSRAGKASWADTERRAVWARRQREEFWTPERRAEQAARAAEVAKDPRVQAARASASRRKWEQPGAREDHAEQMRKRWADPEYRAKVIEAVNTPEVRAARSQAARKRWASLTPEDRKARMRKMRSTFKGGYRLTKIEATVMVALNERELPYFVHKPVDGYVADILVPSLNLVIECDGAYHHNQRLGSDEARDVAMRELGYEVLRLSQEEITKADWARLDESIRELSA